jgi:hypothetical protein
MCLVAADLTQPAGKLPSTYPLVGPTFGGLLVGVSKSAF